MSNIVKVRGNLARNKKEEVRLPIGVVETSEHIWKELRFTNEEKEAWIDVGIVYPYVADQLRLARMTPKDFVENPDFSSAFRWVSGIERGLEACIQLFNEQQNKKIDPFYGSGHLE